MLAIDKIGWIYSQDQYCGSDRTAPRLTFPFAVMCRCSWFSSPIHGQMYRHGKHQQDPRRWEELGQRWVTKWLADVHRLYAG